MKISVMILTTLFIIGVLAACKSDQNTTPGLGSSPGMQPQSAGEPLPDCSGGPAGRGASGCAKNEEGKKCRSRNPDMVLVCRSCILLDEQTAATATFTNPNCR